MDPVKKLNLLSFMWVKCRFRFIRAPGSVVVLDRNLMMLAEYRTANIPPNIDDLLAVTKIAVSRALLANERCRYADREYDHE